MKRLILVSVMVMMAVSCERPELPDDVIDVPQDSLITGGEGEKPDTSAAGFVPPVVVPEEILDRALWASVNGRDDASASVYKMHNSKVLVSWRMYPTDEDDSGFDVYRSTSGGPRVKLNTDPVVSSTCYQDTEADLTQDNTYYLCTAGERDFIDSYTLSAERGSQGLPYISIPLAATSDADLSAWTYVGNDASVGDLDGDGVCEIVLRRYASVNCDGSSLCSGKDTCEDDITPSEMRHVNLYEAYRSDGTFMWRIKSGPNIPLGNSASFAVCDFDGDGKAEVALRTAEGTVFGDGREIGDTDDDGKTDYRCDGADGHKGSSHGQPGSKNIHGGPEFISVVDGLTGKEIARADYIALGKSEDWGDDRYYRSSSYRVGAGNFSGGCPSVVIGRGCYNKIVVEAWDLYEGKLYRRWTFDTTANGGEYSSYEEQGYHSLRCADVDNDGFDEVVYGSCTIDHNGRGLNCCGLGHGDALHVGAFDPSRPDELQIWACYEFGTVGAALRDGATGSVIWQYDDPADVGRAMTADIDPRYPGNEMWWYGGNVHSLDGKDLGFEAPSCNFAIWWTGSLNRQVMNGTVIDQWDPDTPKWWRAFTLYRYDVSSVNGTKENPCWSGDFLGDWREEVILMSNDGSEMRVFSTWYPTEHKFPYLMSDPTYRMSAVNQNIGYNQPNHLGYYLGSDLP